MYPQAQYLGTEQERVCEKGQTGWIDKEQKERQSSRVESFQLEKKGASHGPCVEAGQNHWDTEALLEADFFSSSDVCQSVWIVRQQKVSLAGEYNLNQNS